MSSVLPERPLRMVMTTHYWHPHTGGIETVAAAHAAGLTHLGWAVDAHTSWTDRKTMRGELKDRVSIHRHAAINPFERALRVPVPFPLPGVTRSLIAATVSSDVVVAHGHVYPITLAAARAAARARRPFVLVQHNPWVDYPAPVAAIERAADRVLGRRVIERSAAVVCVSEYTANYVRTIVPDARIVVVPNGVDPRRFFPGPAVPRGRPTQFVCVRRLVPRNGVDLLIEAWRRSQVGNVAKLTIAGDGPDRAALERRAADMPSITFAGRVTDESLVELLQRADASIVPTRSGEGFGLVAAESLACGTPVIATDQGALSEVIRHDIDGLLVPCDDAVALAAAIRSLVDDRARGTRLRAGALHTDWSWGRSVAQLDRVLRSVVEDSASGAGVRAWSVDGCGEESGRIKRQRRPAGHASDEP